MLIFKKKFVKRSHLLGFVMQSFPHLVQHYLINMEIHIPNSLNIYIDIFL
jgi:hypothetical protein